MKFEYCTTCILPSTRPNLKFGSDGSCNCGLIANRKVDWSRREVEFESLVKWTRAQRSKKYDCIIPVSGGKDSTWQALKAKEYGLRCLLVTWRTPSRTLLGQQNLDNLISLGFDHFDVSLDPTFQRAFTRLTFERKGSPAIPMHLAIHSIPVRVAKQLGAPLVLWGEDSASQYGGNSKDFNRPFMGKNWQANYSATSGTTVEDWIKLGLASEDLYWYTRPKETTSSPKEAFLGYFFPWSPDGTAKFASEHGFKAAGAPLLGLNEHSDIDDDMIMPIHHWMKWPKFGFTRSWDNLSLKIRDGTITRSEAIVALKHLGDEEPQEAIEKFCNYLKISRETFDSIVDLHRNHDIWFRDSSGVWRIRNFLLDQDQTNET